MWGISRWNSVHSYVMDIVRTNHNVVGLTGSAIGARGCAVRWFPCQR